MPHLLSAFTTFILLAPFVMFALGALFAWWAGEFFASDRSGFYGAIAGAVLGLAISTAVGLTVYAFAWEDYRRALVQK